MMDFNLDFGKLVKKIPLHSLMGNDGGGWVTSGGLNWITAGGSFWGAVDNKHCAWLKVLVKPIQTLHSQFLDLVTSTRYKMNLTGQVIYLEHYLNDLFDVAQRRIFIEDGSAIIAPFIFLKSENQPDEIVYKKSENADDLILRTLSEYSSVFDFIVKVPLAIPLTEDLKNKIRAAVNQYKQAGSSYTIESF